MASEVGVLDIPARTSSSRSGCTWQDLSRRHRAGTGIIADERSRNSSPASSLREWLQQHLIAIEDVPDAPFLPPPDHQTVLRGSRRLLHAGRRVALLAHMARAGEDAPSMGTDTPLAALSTPRLLYDYFKQLFAQVTIRPSIPSEELVTSMESTVGPERIFSCRTGSCRPINILYPIIDNDQLAKLRHIQDHPHLRFPSVTLPMIYGPARGRCRARAGDGAFAGAGECRSRRGQYHPDSVDRGVTEMRADPACSRPRAFTTTSCGKARGRVARCSSRRAMPVKSITWRS